MPGTVTPHGHQRERHHDAFVRPPLRTGTTITVTPCPRGRAVRAERADIRIKITAAVAGTAKQYFGQVDLGAAFQLGPDPAPAGRLRRPAGRRVAHGRRAIPRRSPAGDSSTCEVTVANQTRSATPTWHRVTSVRQPPRDHRRRRRHGRRRPRRRRHRRPWRGRVDGDPADRAATRPPQQVPAPGPVRGDPHPVGDETIVNYPVPAFLYHGTTYTEIGVTSDGYLVAGGGTAPDVDFVPQPLPIRYVPTTSWHRSGPTSTTPGRGRRRRPPGGRALRRGRATRSWSSGTWPSGAPPTSGASRAWLRGSTAPRTSPSSGTRPWRRRPSQRVHHRRRELHRRRRVHAVDAPRRLERLRRPTGDEHRSTPRRQRSPTTSR